MNLSYMLFIQVVIMFLLIGVGFVLYRTGLLSDEASRGIANLCIYVALPVTIIRSFQIERTQAHLHGFLMSFALTAIALLISALISRAVFRKDPIAVVATTFSNPGAYGIALVSATLGDESVFYIAPFIAVLNLIQWSYGVSVLTEKVSVASVLQKTLRSPVMVAILIGLFFFLTGLRLPEIPARCIDYLAGTNVPLSMIGIGYYLGHVKWKELLTRTSLYLICLMRLIVIPVVTLFVLTLIPAPSDVRVAILIVAIAPTGSNIAIYAHLYHKDFAYAVETVIMTTLISVLTVPLIMRLAEMLWGL